MGKSDNLPYKVTPSTTNGAKTVTITLSGNLTLDEAETIKLMLKQNLEKYQKFLIKLQNVENIDLGMIQLLYSFRWTAERKSKSVSFSFSLLDEHKLLLEHAGFSELINDNQ